MAKKRRRSESFQADDDNARKRLAAFHARMFELPQEDARVVAPETPRVVFKAKSKKHKKKSPVADDGEPVPVVKFNKVKNTKGKKKKAVSVAEKKVVMGPAVVKVPGMPIGVQNNPQEKKLEKKQNVKKAKKASVQASQWNNVKKEEKKDEDDGVDPLEQALGTVKAMEMMKKKMVKKMTVQAPQRHTTKNDKKDDDDEVDPLEQALGSIKEMATKQDAKLSHKKKRKHVVAAEPSAEKPVKYVEIAEEKNATADIAVKSNAVDGAFVPLSKKKRKKKKNRKLQLAQEANNSSLVFVNQKISGGEVANTTPAVCEKETKSDLTLENSANDSASSRATASSLKAPGSRKKRKKSAKVKPMNSASAKAQAPPQLSKEEPLIVSGEAESRDVDKTTAPKDHNSMLSKTMETATASKGTSAVKTPASDKKASSNVEKKTAVLTKPLTPIAASLAKDAKKTNDMFLPADKTLHQPSSSPERAEKNAPPQVVQLTDASSSSESEDESGFDFETRNGEDSLFSRLIDSAARERWELVEVGRLVRLFAAEWGFKGSKTARFLLDTCPELVSVDFLEGLGVNLSAKQLIQVFEAGSGNSGVLMNKMASAVENGHLSVRDPSFVSALERRVALMESNAQVMELLHPLLESLPTVRDVGCLLKQLCEHWQLERKIALVQQVLLSSIVDDLDGNQDEILLDLPDLTGRLDFPSRLDQEDVDENGNLKGFLANEDSEYSGEEGSEEEQDEKDSEDDEDPYEGETDSDEEMEIAGCSRSRNQFIEDEADVGEEDEEEEEEEENEHHSDEESSSDSD